MHGPIASELETAIHRVMDRSWFILGEEVEAFEAEFAEYCGTNYCIGVGSGTDAILLSLLACDIGPGDEVITVAHTFIGTVMAIAQTGATPVLVDVDEHTFTINPTQVAAAITERTKAIVPVHLYGQCADMDPLLEVAQRNGIGIIEDAAQAHGASYRGLRAGGMGDLGCFSFYPTKNLGALGDGGAIVTSDANLAARCRQLRNYGKRDKYHHDMLGVNSRLDEFQAAMLRVKLPHLESWTVERRVTAAKYNELLSMLPHVTPPQEAEERYHTYHVYPVLVTQRDRVRQNLIEVGIECGIHYPVPVHHQICFRNLGYDQHDLPISERLARDELSLPIYPGLSHQQIERVITALGNAFH